MVKRVALYVRVSKEGQDHANQMMRLEEWAARMGFEVAFRDSDVASGRFVQRPGLERTMQAARGHHVHAVAVAKVDRFARSIQHLSKAVNELHDLSVDFYAIDQGLTVRRGDPTSRLILNVLGSVAEWEASIISERTRDGLVGRTGKGRHIKGCGIIAPCPSGRHQSNGIPTDKEETKSETVGLPNGRLIAQPKPAGDETRVQTSGEKQTAKIEVNAKGPEAT